MKKRSLLALPLVVLCTSPAIATDGVLEINQACAVGNGCFPGDSGGFPVTLSASGSYVLTGDLQVPNANTTAIVATDLDVSIDLNGFAIRGITTCSGSPRDGTFACSDTGTGAGINASGTVTVRNGYVTGMGNWGVFTGNASIVEGLHFSHNGGRALLASQGSIVRGNTFRLNGATTVGEDSVAGVSCSFSCVVTQNTMSLLGGSGIKTSGRVADNTLDNVLGDAVILGAGIMEGNEVARATGLGLRASAQVGYAGNVLRGNNDGGAQVSSGVEIGTNLCNANTTCP